MKIKNVIIYAVIATTICIAYVNQQVEIVKLSYKLREKEKKIALVIDRHRILLYNNTSLKAPQYLTGMLKMNSVDLKLPDTTAVTKVRILRKPKTQLAKSAKTTVGQNLLDVFVPQAQAALNMR